MKPRIGFSNLEQFLTSISGYAPKFARVATSLNLDRISSLTNVSFKIPRRLKRNNPNDLAHAQNERAGTRNEVETVTQKKDTQRERMEFLRNPASSDIMRHRTPRRDGPRTKKKKKTW